MKRYQDAAYYMGVLLILSQVPAHAYIDGATGSYVMQIVVAMFLGFGYAFKSSISRIFAKFHRSSKNHTESPKDDRK